MLHLSLTFVEFLKAFPAIFAVIGILVGGAIMLWVTKKFGPMQNQALAQVIKTYEQQVAAQIKLAETQAAANVASLEMQQQHWAEEVKKLEISRDTYKIDLHKVRNDLGAENTFLKLRVQELELRPSLEIVQDEQQTFYREMLGTMKGIGDALQKHDESIDARMEPLQSACSETAKGMQELVKIMIEAQSKPRRRS
jgi:hypothetical protein